MSKDDQNEIRRAAKAKQRANARAAARNKTKTDTNETGKSLFQLAKEDKQKFKRKQEYIKRQKQEQQTKLQRLVSQAIKTIAIVKAKDHPEDFFHLTGEIIRAVKQTDMNFTWEYTGESEDQVFKIARTPHPST